MKNPSDRPVFLKNRGVVRIFDFFHIFDRNQYIVSYKFEISIKFCIDIRFVHPKIRKSEKHENEKVASTNIALLKNWRKSSPPLKKYFFRFSFLSKRIWMQNLLLITNLYETIPEFQLKI